LADVKQPHNEFLATKESYGHFKLVFNFKLEATQRPVL
jgi:hypothetical protein